MDLVSADERLSGRKSTIYSTLQLSAERDFSSPAANRQLAVTDELPDLASFLPASPVAVAHEMDLVQASERRLHYDKILLLIRHGEDCSDQFSGEDSTNKTVPSLSARGVGQVLNLSRRTANFCSAETGLRPELVFVSPSRKVLQTVYLTFPYDTPEQSLLAAKWIAYPATQQDVPVESLAREFRGVNFSLCSGGACQEGLDVQMQRASDLLEFLRQRNERIVVISGESEWLQMLGWTLQYEGALNAFDHGELRAVGIQFR
jgi:broad specificity phosphatase PhoE